MIKSVNVARASNDALINLITKRLEKKLISMI